MNTSRYTPQKIVEEKLSFSIPLYQRLFSWEEKQINGLLHDLKDHFCGSKKDSPYYLGMLSCVGSNGKYDLIDGQQRFTVITLLAIVLRKYDEKWNDFLICKNENRLHFTSRARDNEYLYAQIHLQQIENANVKMENAIQMIDSFMKQSFDFEDAKFFAKKIYTTLSFFFSELPNSYFKEPASLNKYFEAMNAGGKSLEQHEILKVLLLRDEINKERLTRIWNAVCDLNCPVIAKDANCSEDDYREKYKRAIDFCRSNNYDAAFNLCENSYDSEDILDIEQIKPEQRNFAKVLNETGEKSIISFPELLAMVLDLCLNVNGSYLFYRQELLNIFDEHPIDDKQFFYNQLLFYRLLLDYYIVHKEGTEGVNKFDILFRTGASADESLKQYQSMLYVSQTPFYNWLKPILKRLHEEPVKESAQLLTWIKTIDNSLHEFPDNVDKLSYDNKVDRYWFWRLDYYLWERRNEFFKNEEERQIVEEYVFRTNCSIEHLHPQHQIYNDEWTTNDIHSFGNLAMISQGFNSQQSDDPVTVKFARIADHAHNHALQSVKMYLMYLGAAAKPDGWTKEIKDNHQIKMYELLKISYEKIT